MEYQKLADLRAGKVYDISQVLSWMGGNQIIHLGWRRLKRLLVGRVVTRQYQVR